MGSERSELPARRFVPVVEGLEDRTVPSGNVSVGISNKVLVVTGDDAANQISIFGAGQHSVVVRSLDGTTTINGGLNPLMIGGIEKGYNIDMKGGDDFVVISGTRSRGALTVRLGDGNDTLGLFDAGHDGSTSIYGGNGTDNIIVGNSALRQYLFIDSGAGDDTVTTVRVTVRDVGLLNPSGNDFNNNVGSSFGRPAMIGFAAGARPVSPPAAPDTTPPTPTLTTTAPASTNAAIPFTAAFDEDVTQFSAAGVTVTNGTVGSFAQVDARTYTFTVTPTGQGAVTATVAAGAAVDAAGNKSNASATVSRTFDTVAPAAPTFNLNAATDSGTAGDFRTDRDTVTLVGTAEAGATVTLSSTAAPNAPGSGATLATTTAAADGSFTFAGIALTVGPNSLVVTATDAAGNVGTTAAQTFTRNTAPTVANALSNQTATVAGGDQTIDLTNTFTDAERVVRFAVTYPNGQTGTIDINLFANADPITVANFLSYLNSADPTKNYDGSIFHRLVPNFVLQGGGFKFDATTHSFTALTKDPAITNEPSVSNTLGTIAMAKGTGANSAQSEFFFNLKDNSSNLDVQNSGFTAFGQVMNGGLATVQAIANSAAITTYSGTGLPGAAPFPVSSTANTTNFPQNINSTDLVNLTTATELTGAQKLILSATSSDPSTATVSVTGTTLTLHPVAASANPVTITVQALDLDGSITTTTFTVTVS